jgi:TPR repeat protein
MDFRLPGPGSSGERTGQSSGNSIKAIATARNLKKQADGGVAAAQLDYALCLQNGRGFSVSLAEGAKYFKSAADQGLATAQHNYGISLQNGVGVPVNLIKARYFKCAADQGFAAAQHNYGVYLWNGNGISMITLRRHNISDLRPIKDMRWPNPVMGFVFRMGMEFL